MNWAAIIAALLKFFGPLLVEWLQKWLEGRLSAAARRLPAAAEYGFEGSAAHALWDEAIRDLPRLAFARRLLLRRLKAATRFSGVQPLTLVSLVSADAEEIRDAVCASDNE